jgi:acetyl esterase
MWPRSAEVTPRDNPSGDAGGERSDAGAVSARPSPLERLASAAIRTLGALPPAAQRRLGGRPIEIEGPRLEPEVQLYLRLLALDRRAPLEALSVAEARRRTLEEARVFGGRPVRMARVGDLRLRGAEGTLPARFYQPRNTQEGSPLLVYFHGGGWVVGDLDTHDQACRFLARAAGVRVLSVAYRRAPEHRFPAAVQDALAAFRWAVAEAAALGADPARVGVAGDSAGGNLAAVVSMLAAADGGVVPRIQVLVYPVCDLSRKQRSYELFADGFFLTEAQMDWYRDHYLANADDAGDPRCSPLLAEDLSPVPPAYVCLANFDPLRDEGIAYAARLRAAGVPVTLRVHPGLVHGFANAPLISRSARSAMLELAAAVRGGLASKAIRPSSDRR